MGGVFCLQKKSSDNVNLNSVFNDCILVCLAEFFLNFVFISNISRNMHMMILENREMQLSFLKNSDIHPIFKANKIYINQINLVSSKVFVSFMWENK